eukprot:319587_1
MLVTWLLAVVSFETAYGGCSLEEVMEAQKTTCTHVDIDVYANADDALNFYDVYGIATDVIGTGSAALGTFGGVKGAAIAFGVDSMLSVLGFVVGEEEDPTEKLNSAFQQKVNAEFAKIYECMGALSDTIPAKIAQATLEGYMITYQDDVSDWAEFNSIINHMQSFINTHFNGESDVETAEQAIPYLPVFRETSLFHSNAVITFLAAADADCNEGGNAAACSDFDEILREEKARVNDKMLPWIQKARTLIQATYVSTNTGCENPSTTATSALWSTNSGGLVGGWIVKAIKSVSCSTFYGETEKGSFGYPVKSNLVDLSGSVKIKTSKNSAGVACDTETVLCPAPWPEPNTNGMTQSINDDCTNNIKEATENKECQYWSEINQWRDDFAAKYIKPVNDLKAVLNSLSWKRICKWNFCLGNDYGQSQNQWTDVLTLGNNDNQYGAEDIDIGEHAFNALFRNSGGHPIIRRQCLDCDADFKNIYYKRLKDKDSSNAYNNMKTTW